jgi:hypothetical protein
MAMIALGKGANPSGAAIRAELARRFPDLPRAKSVESRDASFSFRIGSLDVIAGLMSAPIPWSDLEGPCAASILWKDAGKALRSHTAHLIVTVAGSDRPLERMRLLTQVTAAVLASCAEAVGVYWTGAGLVIQPPLLVEFATEVLPSRPPLDIWVDIQVGKSNSGKTIGFTRGMESLGHMEFETEDAGESPGELRKRLYFLASYVLEHGPVLKDGDTFGENADERINIVYDESQFGGESQVMLLEYRPPARRRRRSKKKKPTRSRMTAYGYIHALCTLAITIALGVGLHWALAGLISAPILRHVILDLPLLIVGFVLLVVSDSILQSVFGLQAFDKVKSTDED